MGAASRAKKPVSERRKQQNVRAQQNYRERQRQRIKALEAQLSDEGLAVVTTAPAASTETGRVVSPQSLRDQSSLSARTASFSPSSSTVVAGSEPRHLNRDIASDIASCLETLSESTKARIAAGESTIADIFKAGLATLQLLDQPALPSGDTPADASTSTRLQTDKILVPQNRMLERAHTTPSFYSNQLRVKQLSSVAAIRVNAELLGITFEEMTNEHSISPFYGSTLSDEQVQAIKPHLRPTPAQIEHSHHPYLDLFPCATFRQRFIQLVAVDPPLVRTGEFCDDLEKDGLICWGSCLGNRREDEEASGSAAPWDLRSWEAQPWFLKKWWFVLGGSEGEFFQQSRWWHEFRGDKLSALP